MIYRLNYFLAVLLCIGSGFTLGMDRNNNAKQSLIAIFNANDMDQESKKAALESLIADGANINETSPDGLTMLMQAVFVNDMDMVLWLLDNGANVNIESKGNTALTVAISSRNFEMVNLLSGYSVDPLIGKINGKSVLQYLESLAEGDNADLNDSYFTAVDNVRDL
ncbi:MAG TPA: ankyrin repeat domain-containing protein, partial [Candidatus Babeliaceae bacterium]|nr:ankyrin repeat domain-containing protein [Candidatus Babeliaceae bacterium]